jgi:hypothetical protein
MRYKKKYFEPETEEEPEEANMRYKKKYFEPEIEEEPEEAN